MKNLIIGVLAVVVIALIAYTVIHNQADAPMQTAEDSTERTVERISVEPDGGIGDGAEPLEEALEEAGRPAVEVIGQSSDGRDITAHTFGDGKNEILFIGGIHGGYAPNTSLVAYDLIDYLEESTDANADFLETVVVTVIPTLNPDGLAKVTGKSGRFSSNDVNTNPTVQVAGRFNNNEVDLNRNFDCGWQSQGTWQNRTVSGGSTPFSEAESAALRNYVSKYAPDAVVAYYAAAGGVFASTCSPTVSEETKDITNVYANAAGYQASEEFDFYEVTGDMVNWFARQGTPAISVLLTDRSNPEWSKNKAGIDALIEYYAK